MSEYQKTDDKIDKIAREIGKKVNTLISDYLNQIQNVNQNVLTFDEACRYMTFIFCNCLLNYMEFLAKTHNISNKEGVIDEHLSALCEVLMNYKDIRKEIKGH